MRAVTGPGCVVDGRYELLDRIGQGAMGTVWRARDLVLDRNVAVKELRLPALMPDRERTILRERTLREAKVSAKLSHPCVVTVYDVIETDGVPWIVMELVTARSLQRVLAEDGPLPPWQAAETGIMLVGALAGAHAAGIVHRDVKPGNVLLTRGGRAVLTDFGIAAVDGDPALTQTGMVMGTPGFCAPERIRGNPASPASDLWSLGATLYAAVEGRAPFDGPGGPMAVLASIVHSDPPPATSAGPLAAVITALLTRDPALRPDAVRASRMLADAAATARAMTGGGASRGSTGASPGFIGTQGSTGASRGLASAWPAGASARTEPTGFPAALGPTRASASAGPAASPAGPRPVSFRASRGPNGFLACPPSAPFACGTGTAQFPAGTDKALFAPAGPADPVMVAGTAAGASLAAGADPAAGASPGEAAGPAMGAGAAGRSGIRLPPGRRLLAVGLAGAAIIVAGLAAALVLSRTMGPSAHGRNTGGAPLASAPLPAGYRWYTRPAFPAGNPGFVMAVPAGWQARQQGTATYLRNAASGGTISISPAPAAVGGPVTAARTLEHAALGQGSLAGYHRIAITSFFLRGTLAGAWRFAYREPGTGAMDGLVVVTPDSAPGGGPFELMASAPAASWPHTRIVFAEALRTFSPRE